MDLEVHQAILYYAMKKATDNNTVNSDFLSIWAGNWMTDINQASCVLNLLPPRLARGLFKNSTDFDKFEKMKKDKFSVYNAFVSKGSVQYDLNPLLLSIEENWINLIHELWTAQIKSVIEKDRALIDNTAGIGPFDLQKIGMYYPLDHFDVVASEDVDEIKGVREGFTKTAYNGVYEHAFDRLLRTAFILRDQNDKNALFYLGRALHVLADFYAHSNFVYLILRYFCADKRYNAINEYFDKSWEKILFDRCGSLENVPVMTGRFDKIDTIASILKIYKNYLIPDFNDFKEEIIKIDKYKSLDDRLEQLYSKVEQSETVLVLNVLFGTFSNIRFVNEFKGIAFFTAKVIEFLKRFVGEIKNEFLNIIEDIVEQEIKSTDEEHLVDLVKELKIYDPDDAKSELKNHLKAAKVMYYEHMIRKTLIDNLFEHNTEYLPHHTLIANDSDDIHPVRRLEYKLACFFAHSVSKEVLECYYKNGSIEQAKTILESYYMAPEVFYKSKKEPIKEAIEEMYGRRWWEYIQ